MFRINGQERVLAVVRAMPHVFALAPCTNYQKIVSHSQRELMLKTWARTGEQMRRAMDKKGVAGEYLAK